MVWKSPTLLVSAVLAWATILPVFAGPVGADFGWKLPALPAISSCVCYIP